MYCSFSNKWTGGRLKVNTNVVYISGVRTTSPVLYIWYTVSILSLYFCIVKCMEQRDRLNVQYTITARNVCKRYCEYNSFACTRVEHKLIFKSMRI